MNNQLSIYLYQNFSITQCSLTIRYGQLVNKYVIVELPQSITVRDLYTQYKKVIDDFMILIKNSEVVDFEGDVVHNIKEEFRHLITLANPTAFRSILNILPTFLNNPLERARPTQLSNEPINPPRQNASGSYNALDSLFSRQVPVVNAQLEHSANQNNLLNLIYTTDGGLSSASNETDVPPRFNADDRRQREVLEYNEEKTTDVIYPTATVITPPAGLVNTTADRPRVSSNTIKEMARTVKTLVTGTNTCPPDFTNTTRVGYRKIKNYLHNITKIWLSNTEINEFVLEYNALN